MQARTQASQPASQPARPPARPHTLCPLLTLIESTCEGFGRRRPSGSGPPSAALLRPRACALGTHRQSPARGAAARLDALHLHPVDGLHEEDVVVDGHLEDGKGACPDAAGGLRLKKEMVRRGASGAHRGGHEGQARQREPAAPAQELRTPMLVASRRGGKAAAGGLQAGEAAGLARATACVAGAPEFTMRTSVWGLSHEPTVPCACDGEPGAQGKQRRSASSMVAKQAAPFKERGRRRDASTQAGERPALRWGRGRRAEGGGGTLIAA
jgi:hypothetical protein